MTTAKVESFIADLEQAELNKLETQTKEGALRTLSVDESPVTWIDHLEEFVNNGERAALRRLLLDEDSAQGPSLLHPSAPAWGPAS